jgi:hypothetical protein
VERVEQEVSGPEGAPASQMVFYLPHNGREDPPDGLGLWPEEDVPEGDCMDVG